MRILRHGSFVGVCVVVLVCLMVPVSAGAQEGGPLQITGFSMQFTKETRKVHSVNQKGEEETTVVNVPYEHPFTQAGAHPWGLTTVIEFATKKFFANDPGIWPTQEPKDITVGLPPGLLGDPMAVPHCSLTSALALGECPAVTQVGVYRFLLFGGKEILGPIDAVVPERGQTAEFVFVNEFKVSVVLTGHLVRVHEGSHEGYGLTVSSNNIPTVNLARIETTFWGVPADPSHDPMRGLECNKVKLSSSITCKTGTGNEPSGVQPVPFLTLPTDCAAGPGVATLRADSWEEPGSVREGRYEGYKEQSVTMPGVTGCDKLVFHPEIEVQPDVLGADEPVGLGVNLKVPLSEEPQENATPQLRNAVVTLPEGMSVSPGVVDGIRACEPTGPEGINITGPESERVSLTGELQLAPGKCPDASIVGSAEAITPLLPEPVKGHIFLARPGCGNPALGQASCTEQDALNGNLYKLYLELGGTGPLAVTGVHIKVAGKTEANPATGQLTTVFDDNPQTPFTELKIHLNGGPRAPIANPAVCGPAVTTADFRPWSAPGVTPAPESLFMQGTADATPSSFFTVSGCSDPVPFSPSVISGTVTPQAGQFSAFTLNLARQDREQYVKGIQIHTPPGLLGMLSNVPLCGTIEAEAGSCPEASRIGRTRVATGAGSHPFEIEGNVYLTGPYQGDPFGLSIVVHVITGPFNLGIVVVRARIAVNPEDSSLTVTTDETGPHAVPQIVFGVPARLKRITVNIDKPQFMFNPTNCSSQQITATISGSQNATWTSSSPFAVGGCKSLVFKPKFSVSTNGHTSRKAGASLDAKLSYPKGAFGNDANIASVKVSLPKQLPSYLPTLQKACLAQTFNANPAGCPAGSIVGIAKASTPLLPVGLSGPVYFVSHGGQEFPSLIVVLQGDNVRVDLTGSTFISKGITSSTFKTIPDVPVNTFELFLPQRTNHALAANGNLCKNQSKLRMPTEFHAQNGLVLKQSTRITVTGCASKAKSARRRAHNHDVGTNGRTGR